ncbi:alpha/beta hydrolase [Clostridium taeniosporum]|uniref:Alpha/beta hydrolase n=1 Tax=Clostridium taeniosporum TaxID=394958 RepID=A0A1D7XM20_9CLOT|nr:alpha/beta hydrolase [Clostridium taeniosporum]AOR24240.1 alpha/beta hydrolase [Clostridium taeniosporum]
MNVIKKILKLSLIIILILSISLGIIFRKKIQLTYTIFKDIISLKNNFSLNNEFELSPIDNADYKDIVYKDANNVKLKLDIYKPSKKMYKTSPVLLYVHGGSWVYGDKSIPRAINPILDIFRDNGFTIISTEYELMRSNENFQKQVCDVKDTIRWIYKNSSKYNLNSNQIGIIGMSSGAHLSLMSAYSPDNEFTDDLDLANYPSKVKYVIDFFGPTNLNLLKTSGLNWDLTNILNSIKDKNLVASEFNPIKYVNSNIPKTLIIHSKNDSLVPYESSLELYNKCIEEKASVKLVSLEQTSHDMSIIFTQDIKDLTKEVLKFIVNNSPLY